MFKKYVSKMITQQDINDLCSAALYAGFSVNHEQIYFLEWNAGLETHIPLALPANYAAVYIFNWNGKYLKVGKANSKSHSRYKSHHYNPHSSKSNLSRSLMNSPDFETLFDDFEVGEWLKLNTTRYNILIPTELGKRFVHFVEAYFLLKCNPIFED
jgi:hypothetical protein